MGNLFNVEGPVMRTLSRVADLLWLNFVTLACCLPIITIGAAMTALHYSSLKIIRRDDTSVTKLYFKSFKDNFVQATIIWVLILFVIAAFVLDFKLFAAAGIKLHMAVKIIIGIIGAIALFTAMYVFPVLAKFDNKIVRTIKNSFMISLMMFPKTVLMVIIYLVPVYITIYVPTMFPLVTMFGISAPALAFAWLYNKPFKKLEDLVRAASGEESVEPADDERIFKDELDESLIASEEESQNGHY